MSLNVPLVAYIAGKRTIIGSANVEERDGEYIVSGVLESEYSDILDLSGHEFIASVPTEKTPTHE